MGAIGAQTVNTTTRLEALRKLMVLPENNVTAVVVPSEDQHSSEYIATCDERRAFISGFNGSAGCAVVTLNDAYLFTDGRYFLQAEKQLDQNWTLMKTGLPDVPTWQEFLHKNLEKKSRIGVDSSLITASDAESLQKSLKPKESHLVSLPHNLIDAVWKERPPRPANPVFPLDVTYSGESHQDKLTHLREELAKKQYKAFVVNMLDEVAWLFNLRGSDIDFNPVFFAYAVITENKTILFVNGTQVNDTVRTHLGKEVEIKEYSEFFGYLKGLGAELGLSKESQVLLGDKSSLAIAEAIGRVSVRIMKDNIEIARSPVADLKSIKNDTEIEGFRQSHIRDGAALARYFAWLEEQLNNGAVLNESQAADQLEKYRSEGDLFRGLSFTTISATGPNGAIIHYSPDPNDCATVEKDQHFGSPSQDEKRAFTRVLQGHIAIDVGVFPSGTSGMLLCSFRLNSPLMNILQDSTLIPGRAKPYGKMDWIIGEFDVLLGSCHDTERFQTWNGPWGHFLNVHEGPQGIGQRIVYNSTPLKAGMTLSNEPGYYADGKFGIRIENIVIVKKVDTPNNFGDKGYLGFEHVTMCPIHKKLIDTSLLTVKETEWLNAYHKEIFEKVSPLLQNDERALKWLERECSPL
ncbi:hypothetical protein NLI96_g10907 [Meripilus lineatus]|uniref:Creatinase/aminopeptidase n=1 Tax=Meripilus lineatus TaxID=2056292 RepID=A0AAD5YBH4_9APHY|nr:hypothetical protein NLI96_g10907 [Physisporinus lineatus]